LYQRDFVARAVPWGIDALAIPFSRRRQPRSTNSTQYRVLVESVLEKGEEVVARHD
jgi:hypothetical protein